MRDNKKGSTIVTAIVVTMIVFIILGVALTIASSYQQRAINEHARKQAYLTGISVCDVIAPQLNGSNADRFIPKGNGDNDVIHISDVTLPNGMGGQASADIEKKDDQTIYIRVTSTYNKQTEEVQLTMQKYNNEWCKKVYSKIGETFDEEKTE